MNNEPKKPAEELSEKELEGIVGGGLSRAVPMREDLTRADMHTRIQASVVGNEKRMDEVAMKLAAR